MRRGIVLGVALLTVLAPVAAASTARAPQAQVMVLAASDFPAGANVLSQTPTPSPFLPKLAYTSAYTRSFAGARIGSTDLLELQSSVEVAKSKLKVIEFMSSLDVAMRNPIARKAIINEIKTGFAAAAQGQTSVQLLRARSLHTGDAAVDFAFKITTPKVTVSVGELFLEVGPALGYAVYASTLPGLDAGQAFALAKTLTAHMKSASEPPPSNTALPTITGSAAFGQILTASPGSWTGGPSTDAYQWLRCSAAGTGCVAISGATQSSYTVSTADASSTLAVAVTATNPGGGTAARSKPTAAVPAA